jgi:hypothetical protein
VAATKSKGEIQKRIPRENSDNKAPDAKMFSSREAEKAGFSARSTFPGRYQTEVRFSASTDN